jgi:hypothetical protein
MKPEFVPPAPKQKEKKEKLIIFVEKFKISDIILNFTCYRLNYLLENVSLQKAAAYLTSSPFITH